ncbi:hypothetical protein [Halorubrum tibetense]|uniref:Uncharacterized protein n=1 Tax=Halorubrum tibetense TaxID=175631 RepID=A0ABD5SE54_9EURY
MTVDPPAADEVFDDPATPADVDVDPATLDREWVVGEAAAVFGLTRDEADQWVVEDGVLAVYARIQEHWGAI